MEFEEVLRSLAATGVDPAVNNTAANNAANHPRRWRQPLVDGKPPPLILSTNQQQLYTQLTPIIHTYIYL